MKKSSGKKFRTVLIITLCWTLFAAVSFISQYFVIYDLVKLKQLSGSISFTTELLANIIMGVIAGLSGGYLLVFRMGARYRKRSFAFGIFNSGLMFIVTYVVLATFALLLVDLVYFSFQHPVSTAFSMSVENVLFNIMSPSFFVNIFLWGFFVSCTQFMLQVNDKFGPGILWKFITGRYYRPRQEERIFMFLDLRSSTTIAEKMSSHKFFSLLKEIYDDITDPILDSQGEIYQYVGDEVVVTWPVKRGLARNNFLDCFFDIREVLKNKEVYYKRQFGFIPAFKAGLHIGEVTVGEIGSIKKDIVYSGDVLNTTSRIQGQCNYHRTDILLSSALVSRLEDPARFERVAGSDILLKGKSEKVPLYTIKSPHDQTASTVNVTSLPHLLPGLS